VKNPTAYETGKLPMWTDYIKPHGDDFDPKLREIFM